jgi:hypothetical protein
LDTVKTGTAAPDSHSAQGEAHHVESLPPLAVPVLVALWTIKLLLHLFTSVRHYGYFRDELYTSTWPATSTGATSMPHR